MTSKERGQVQVFLDSLAAAWNDGDGKRYMSHFHEQAVLFLPAAKKILRGPEAIQHSHGPRFGRGQTSFEILGMFSSHLGTFVEVRRYSDEIEGFHFDLAFLLIHDHSGDLKVLQELRGVPQAPH